MLYTYVHIHKHIYIYIHIRLLKEAPLNFSSRIARDVLVLMDDLYNNSLNRIPGSTEKRTFSREQNIKLFLLVHFIV